MIETVLRETTYIRYKKLNSGEFKFQRSLFQNSSILIDVVCNKFCAQKLEVRIVKTVLKLIRIMFKKMQDAKITLV